MKKYALAISLLALAAATPAHAFDTINWNWDADVQTSIVTTATSAVAVVPTGLEQVESEQLSLGAYSSSASTIGVTNSLTSLSGLTTDDLVSIETSAVAVGNSAVLQSTVSTNFDVNQTFGGADLSLGTGLTGTLLDISLPGTINADATTIGIVNALVDNTATGVANNLTVTLNPATDQDAFLLGNNVQTAVAAVTSTSVVDLVSFSDVSGIGAINAPAVTSAATSIGNNLAVSIIGQ